MEDRIILGQDAVYESGGEAGKVNRNVAVFGQAGCGMTESIVEPRLLETENDSLVVTTGSRKLADRYGPLFTDRGYRVQVLDFTRTAECTEPVDFTEPGREKTALFICSSPVDPARSSAAAAVFEQAVRSLSEAEENRPVDILYDVTALGGRIHGLEEFLPVFREKGLSMTLLAQSESQLCAIYGESAAEAIIDCCDTYAFLGGMDERTCTSVSRRAGVPVAEIMTLPPGQAWILRRGQEPLLTGRYDVRSDERYPEAAKQHRN